MRKPVYWGHDRQRMRQRNINEAEVDMVLANPHTVYPSTVPGRTVLIGDAGGRRIKVVIVAGSMPVEIVTVAD